MVLSSPFLSMIPDPVMAILVTLPWRLAIPLRRVSEAQSGPSRRDGREDGQADREGEEFKSGLH